MPEISQQAMLELIGKKIYGYCGGHFGRDGYGTKVIEAIGPDWVVCRFEDGDVELADGFEDFSYLLKFIEENSDPSLNG
jgi:hypothetical protein